MAKINTAKIGDALENKVYDYFKRQIESGELGPSEQLRIFQKKGYYSKDREKEIIFDVTIEFYLPNQKDFSILWVIECKNYSNHRVPVDDTEEFFAKLQQISGANCKGVIVSNSAFQSSTVKFSKSKGIGLARLLNDDELNWCLNRKSYTFHIKVVSNKRVREIFDQNTIQGSPIPVCFYYDGNYLGSLREYAILLLGDGVKAQLKNSSLNSCNNPIEFLTECKIKDATIPFIDNAPNSFEIKTDELISKIRQKFGFKVLMNSSLPEDVLGTIDFFQSVIKVDSFQCNSDSRAKFTLAHEIGHLVLGHSKYLLRESFTTNNEKILLSNLTEHKDILALEYQANRFASLLLVPPEKLQISLNEVIKLFSLRDRGYGMLYLDNQRCNVETFYHVTDFLCRKYKVSRQMMEIRLLEVGFLKKSVNAFSGPTCIKSFFD